MNPQSRQNASSMSPRGKASAAARRQHQATVRRHVVDLVEGLEVAAAARRAVELLSGDSSGIAGKANSAGLAARTAATLSVSL